MDSLNVKIAVLACLLGTLDTGTSSGDVLLSQEHDFISLVSSEQDTFIADARAADDFIVSGSQWRITKITGSMAALSPNYPSDWAFSLYDSNPDGGPSRPFFLTVKGATSVTNLGSWNQTNFDYLQVEFDSLDIVLAPGTYWISIWAVGNGEHNDRGAWGTANTGGPVNNEEGYWKSDHFGVPEWTPLSELGKVEEDMAMVIEGDLVSAAALIDFEVVFGQLLSGALEDLMSSDEKYVHTGSTYGFQASEPNLLDFHIGFESEVNAPESLTLTIESYIDNPNGAATARLKNWTTGALDEVGTYGIGREEEAVTFDDIDTAGHVRNIDGRIEVSIKHVVVATFALSGFQSYFDHVRVLVN